MSRYHVGDGTLDISFNELTGLVTFQATRGCPGRVELLCDGEKAELDVGLETRLTGITRAIAFPIRDYSNAKVEIRWRRA